MSIPVDRIVERGRLARKEGRLEEAFSTYRATISRCRAKGKWVAPNPRFEMLGADRERPGQDREGAYLSLRRLSLSAERSLRTGSLPSEIIPTHRRGSSFVRLDRGR